LRSLFALTLLLSVPATASESPSKTQDWQDVRQIAIDAKFDGIILVSRGENMAWTYAGERIPQTGKQRAAAYPPISDGSGRYHSNYNHAQSEPRKFDIAEPWRWASVTKQIVAVLVLQEVAKGSVDLDASVASYLPDFKSPNAAQISVRSLLRHQTGLPNPDDTQAKATAMANYYLKNANADRNPLTGYCAGPVKGAPNEGWSYNNCDYIVAGALLKAVTGKPWTALFKEHIAKPFKLRSVSANLDIIHPQEGYIDGKIEPGILLAAFDSSGALSGTIEDLWKFDRALMTGKLLPKKQMEQLWDGRPELGFIALGQWVFDAPLKGCDKPVKVVERRGAIGGVQVRNFILPELDTTVIAFTNRSEFDFGEVWQGSGLSYDLLAKVSCQ
jgi:D-alanyl-D-alanine carboxypeptidase